MIYGTSVWLDPDFTYFRIVMEGCNLVEHCIVIPDIWDYVI